MNPTPERTEKTPSEMVSQPCAVPLIERLRSVPKDAREMIEVGHCAHRNIPYGAMCHEAANALASHADLVAQNEALRGALEAADKAASHEDTFVSLAASYRVKHAIACGLNLFKTTPPAKA